MARVLFVSMLVMAFLVPADAQAEDVTTCTEDESTLSCTIWVDEVGEGPTFTYTLLTQATVEIITYTSMSCTDWDNYSHVSADPMLFVYDDEGTLLFSDDDSAVHNDGSNMCWDAYLNLVDLPAGTYTLQADAYDEDHLGTYTLEVSGGSWDPYS